MQHCAHRHHQEALENHIVECVGDGAVHGERGAQSDANDHETDLVDHAVGQDPAKIIFNHRIKNREAGHGGTDINQYFGTCETARQCVNGNFGRECAQEHSACWRGFGIGIGQPVMQ